MDRKHIALFCGLALGVSWAMQMVCIFAFGLEAPQTKILGVATMWSPTLIAFGFLALHRPARRGVAWRLGDPRYLPVGLTVETLIGFAVVGILVAFGAARSGWFTFSSAGVAISGGPWLLGHGGESWPFFVANVALTAAAFSIFSLIATVGEEFAWRGFLQGHLIGQLGVRGGITVLGLIWAAWHLPMLLAGYNYPQYPLLGAFVLFPIQLVAASFFFGWLTLRSGSFWPAALAHAAVNSIQQGLVDNLHLSVPLIYEDLLRIGLTVGVGLVCLMLLSPRREKSPAKGIHRTSSTPALQG